MRYDDGLDLARMRNDYDGSRPCTGTEWLGSVYLQYLLSKLLAITLLSYRDTIVRFPDNDPGSWLQSEGYYPDTAGFMDNLNPDTGENISLTERNQLTNQGNYIQLVGSLLPGKAASQQSANGR